MWNYMKASIQTLMVLLLYSDQDVIYGPDGLSVFISELFWLNVKWL